MSKQDYYSTLGLGKDASKDEIKKAYRKLVMKYHPDKHKNDKAMESKFKTINEAYEILSDDNKKSAYDQYGHNAFENGGFGSQSQGFGSQGFSGSFNFNPQDMGGIFEEMFGFGGRGNKSRSQMQGSDLSVRVDISLEEAFSGVSKNIRVQSYASCESCSGAGGTNGSSTCSKCQGHGAVRMQRGLFVVEQSCDSCQGQGKIIKNPCTVCFGQGRINKKRDINIDIPKGIDNDMNIKIKNKGEAGLRGATAGDLYVQIALKKHDFFWREGNNLFCEIPINFTQAALGCLSTVPSLDGKSIEINIPEGMQSKNKILIRDKGMPFLNSSKYGNLYVITNVETPTKLNARQKELLKEFEEISSKNQPKMHSFFKKMSNLWPGFN